MIGEPVLDALMIGRNNGSSAMKQFQITWLLGHYLYQYFKSVALPVCIMNREHIVIHNLLGSDPNLLSGAVMETRTVTKLTLLSCKTDVL